MKATVDGVTYEGTEDEIRRIVENPPARPGPGCIQYHISIPPEWPGDFPRNGTRRCRGVEQEVRG